MKAEMKDEEMRDEQARRFEVAREFISTLSSPPVVWYVSGSTARGDFRPDSDIDITALWQKNEDIPWPSKEDDYKFPFGGYKIDLYSFAKDWRVFQLDPELLLKIFPELREMSGNQTTQ